MKGQHLGELEELVLLAVCICHTNAYGVSIRSEIRSQTGRSISLSAIHATLQRLEDKGILSSDVGGAIAERGGRRKRLFSPTNYGMAQLKDRRNERAALWNQIPEAVLS